MFDRLLRPLKERIFVPAARGLAKAVTPNALTAIALVIGIGAVALVLAGLWVPAVVLWILNRIVDGFDGTVARLRNEQTDFGAYFDILADFVIYSLIPLVLAYRMGIWIEAAVLLATFYLNAASWMYLSALLEKRHAGAEARGEMTGVSMPEGIIGGVETMAFFTAFLLFPSIAGYLFLAMATLVFAGVIARVVWAKREL